jgi:phosphoglucosamine mutase
LINVEVKNKPEISTVPQIVKAIREVENQLGDDGRVVVRYSGTQNLCRVMVEGSSDDATEKYCSQIADVVKDLLG